MALDRRRPRWPARRWSALGLAAVVVLGTGTAYAVKPNGTTAHYRTVAARTSDVEQTLALTGSVDAAKRADLSFGTDGTLAKLLVAVGDTVKAGQVIGTLDASDLDAALTQAEAEYARAVAQLAADRAAQASAVSDVSTPTTPPTTPSSSPTSSSSSTPSAALLKALKKAQDDVILAQSQASQAIAAAKQALATQQQACAAAADPDADSTACDTALAAVQQAQDVVDQAQDTLAKALDALAQLLGQALGQVQGQTHAKTAASDASSSSTPDSNGSNPSDDGGATVTAAQLASDQANIESANAAVVSARQNRAQATLRSTRAGKVVALDIAVGDAVTAGSTVATVVGGTAVTVTGTVTESQVDSVKVGQTVRVGVPGVSRTTTGRVTAIGLVADSSSGTTSYPVTVTVANPTIPLPAGSRASMQIVLATAHDVVTVPISAVSRRATGTAATVQTWNGSTLSTKTVQLGAVGSREVAITSGLTAGAEVVLADVDQAIKGASTTINDRGGFVLPAGGNFRAPAGAVTFSKAG